MFQLILTLLIFLALVIPVGRYLYKVADHKKTFADPVMNRVDGAIYKVCGIDPKAEMSWKKYVITLLLANTVMILVGYLILRVQGWLFFNPNEVGGMESTLSFNTIISFMTNTNLQHYSGESGLSYLSQMIVITMMMFTSAATGYAACMAMVRGFCGKKTLGNYFVDMVRVITRVLIPLSLFVAIILVSQGSPQTLPPNTTITTIEGTAQDIPLGPIASLESIKHIGTNGGGYLGANSTTPFENPNILTNILELFSMIILPGACVIAFGLMFYYRKKEKDKEKNKDKPEKEKKPIFGKEGRTIFIAMGLIFIIGLCVCFFAEKAGNPLLAEAGINQSMGSMEGKEVRLGVAQSSLFTTVTTAFSTGTVNNMHDTLTPLGGMVALSNMMLNTVFGGIGVGLMNMLLYMLLAVFLCGLMIGRTPEYLGRKIESREIKLAVIAIIIHPLLILGGTAIAVATTMGTEAISNPGFHGLSQVLYEFSSSAANNGFGFEGLGDNTTFWNISTGIVMFVGRYAPIVIQLAIAGSLLKKREVNESLGTLNTGKSLFGIVLAFVVLIFAALTFFPVISLGPIAEHLILWR